MWNLKSIANEQTEVNRNRLIDTGNKLVGAREEGSWGTGEVGEGD